MRYLVTGAAGFIGSHLAERLRDGGTRRRRSRLLHRLLRRRAEGGERPRARRSVASTSHATRSTSTGIDGVFHLAGQPGVRSFGDVFETYLERNVLASQRLFEAAARDGVRVVFASSSSIYGEAEEYPTRRDGRAAAGLALRHHEAHLRAPRPRDRTQLRARRGRAAVLQRLRPAAAARHGVHANRDVPRRGRVRSTSSATASSRAASPTSATSSAATIAAMDGGSGTYNVGGGEEATMRDTIDDLRGARRPPPRDPRATRRCPATSGARRPIRR